MVNNIGERIRQTRIDMKMSQDELGKRCGYKSRTSINKIELSRIVPINKVNKIAAALDVPPSYLMGWSDIFGNPIERMNEEQHQLLMKWDMLTSDEKELIMTLMDKLIE